MSPPLATRAVHDRDEIRAFFDGIAPRYAEAHGDAERLLERRLRLIRRLIGAQAGEVLLDIGCGPGVHVFPLAPLFRRAIGIDLSPRMIAAACAHAPRQSADCRMQFQVAAAEDLSCIEAQSVGVVLCTGALEHMPDKRSVLAQVGRVLEAGGRFVCLTVNADHVWYRFAARLGYEVTHLSTDAFIGARTLRHLLADAGLQVRELGYWNFVAKGDMPPWAARSAGVLDLVGRALAPRWLRGGLYVCAVKPEQDSPVSGYGAALPM